MRVKKHNQFYLKPFRIDHRLSGRVDPVGIQGCCQPQGRTRLLLRSLVFHEARPLKRPDLSGPVKKQCTGTDNAQRMCHV
jgi:hypothetical protein